MAGGRIPHLSRAKSAFVEFLFKPAILSAAIFAQAFFKWASPPRTHRALSIMQAADNVARSGRWGDWPGNAVFAWKLGLFTHVLAGFLDSDNAYFVFFEEWMREYVALTDRELVIRGTKAKLKRRGIV